MKNRPEIDGLRALAVVPVILFHGRLAGFDGGYIGVDVFFVISGYLITSIILEEKEAGTFSIANFYERRARRILPALFFVMLACMPFAWFWMNPFGLENFGQSVFATVTFSNNFLLLMTSHYFAPAVETKPLMHTWSLAIEEQYYLVYPAFLILCWKLGRQKLIGFLVALMIVSLGLAEWGWRQFPSENYYFSLSRGWELLLGGIAGFYLRSHHTSRPGRDQFLALAGFLMIAGSLFFFSPTTPFPSFIALVPTLGAFMVILFASPGTWVCRFLSMRAFVGVGLISYSAYLWHQPLFAFFRLRLQEEPGPGAVLGLAMLAMGLAWMSWMFIEKPFRDKNRTSRKQIFTASVLASMFFIGIGLAGHFSKGFMSVYETRLSDSQKILFTGLKQAVESGGVGGMLDDGNCKFWTPEQTEIFEKRFVQCTEKHKKAVLILGDSHGMDLFNSLALVSEYPFVVGISKGGCRPDRVQSGCSYFETIGQFISAHKDQISLLVYTQNGSYSLTNAKDLPVNKTYLVQVKNFLEPLARQVNTLWLGPQVGPNIDLEQVNLLTTDINRLGRRFNLEPFLEIDRHIAELSKGASYTFASKIQLMDFDPKLDLVVDGNFTYSDQDHWSAFGERYFGRRLLKNKILKENLTRSGN